jgi:hypothetical protein
MSLTTIIAKLNKVGKKELAEELRALTESKKISFADITSEDLEEYASSKQGNTDREKEIRKLLQDRIRVGKFFDWKEEDKIEGYIQKFQQKNSSYKYVYNAYPGGDGWYVIFSKVKLPKAETL